jgi:hypothetical protein
VVTGIFHTSLSLFGYSFSRFDGETFIQLFFCGLLAIFNNVLLPHSWVPCVRLGREIYLVLSRKAHFF